MRSRLVIIIVALVLGGVAAILAANYLDSARSRIVAESEPVEVLVAAEDIPRGLSAEDLIERELLVIREIPAQFVSSNAVSSERAIRDQILALDMAEGEQVTDASFQYPADVGIAYTIPEGHLALTIPSDEIRGVAGFIKPGDRVSVIASLDGGNMYDKDGVPIDPDDPDAEGPLAFLNWDLGTALPDKSYPVEYPITRIALAEVKVLAVEREITRTTEAASTSGPTWAAPAP